MTLKELTNKIGIGVEQQLDGFKFVKSRSQLLQKTEEGFVAIEIDAMQTSKPNVAKLGANAQVRIDSLELAYARFHPFIDELSIDFHPTVSINCDELLCKYDIIHGFRKEEKQIDGFIVEYAKALEKEVIPWLDLYSTESTILNGLISNDPTNWITSDRIVRYQVLLAIFATRKDWQQFDVIANEFEKYCSAPHARVFEPIAKAIIFGLKSNFCV